MTHTPGPWKMEAGRQIVTPSGTFYLAYGKDKHGNALFIDFCELDANARLIAAAPDLLKAVEDMLETTELNMDDMEDSTHETIERAQAALAKADGKEG